MKNITDCKNDICAWCQKPFPVTSKNKKCCSDVCSVRYCDWKRLVIQTPIEDYRKIRNKEMPAKCEICGTEFVMERANNNCCSDDCKAALSKYNRYRHKCAANGRPVRTYEEYCAFQGYRNQLKALPKPEQEKLKRAYTIRHVSSKEETEEIDFDNKNFCSCGAEIRNEAKYKVCKTCYEHSRMKFDKDAVDFNARRETAA